LKCSELVLLEKIHSFFIRNYLLNLNHQNQPFYLCIFFTLKSLFVVGANKFLLAMDLASYEVSSSFRIILKEIVADVESALCESCLVKSGITIEVNIVMLTYAPVRNRSIFCRTVCRSISYYYDLKNPILACKSLF